MCNLCFKPSITVIVYGIHAQHMHSQSPGWSIVEQVCEGFVNNALLVKFQA